MSGMLRTIATGRIPIASSKRMIGAKRLHIDMRHHRSAADAAKKISQESRQIGLGVAPALGMHDADQLAASGRDRGLAQEGARRLGRNGQNDRHARRTPRRAAIHARWPVSPEVPVIVG